MSRLQAPETQCTINHPPTPAPHWLLLLPSPSQEWHLYSPSSPSQRQGFFHDSSLSLNSHPTRPQSCRLYFLAALESIHVFPPEPTWFPSHSSGRSNKALSTPQPACENRPLQFLQPSEGLHLLCLGVNSKLLSKGTFKAQLRNTSPPPPSSHNGLLSVPRKCCLPPRALAHVISFPWPEQLFCFSLLLDSYFSFRSQLNCPLFLAHLLLCSCSLYA